MGNKIQIDLLGLPWWLSGKKNQPVNAEESVFYF